MTRDKDLIRELLLKLEALPMRPGAVEIIPPGGGKIAIPGYDAAQIDYNLSKICEAGFIDDGDFRPYVGTAFRGLTAAGHDFLDSVRDPKIEAPPDVPSAAPAPLNETVAPSPDETLPQAAFAEIHAVLAEIKTQLPAITTSNAIKAEILTDVTQLEGETARPAPRRSFMKLFLESLRDNLAKAAGAATAAALVATIVGILAKYFGVL